MNQLKRAFSYLKPYTKEAGLAMVFLGLVVVLDLSIPRMVQTLVDQGIANQDMDLILRTSLMMVGASILSATMMIGNTVFAVRASRGFEADMREAMFKKIQTFSFGNLDDLSSSQLLTRLTSDLNQIQRMVTMTLRIFTRAPIMMVGSLSIMWATNPQLTKYVLLLMPIAGVFITFFIRYLQPLFTRIQEKLDQLNKVLEENLSGIRIVKAFVRRDYEGERFNKANTELTEVSVIQQGKHRTDRGLSEDKSAYRCSLPHCHTHHESRYCRNNLLWRNPGSAGNHHSGYHHGVH
jgi:ATP-binding cassette subfamily B protein